LFALGDRGRPSRSGSHGGVGVLLGGAGAPTGKRLAPIMVELVPRLRRLDELVVTDDTAVALLAMSPATMDRRLAPDRAEMLVRGHSRTKPGSLLKDDSDP